MKNIVFAAVLAGMTSSAFAQNAPSVPEITKQLIRSVEGYANSISCGGVKISPKDIAALVPYKTMDDRDNAKYAVLWSGDIGCAGGSGTESTNIAIVTIGAGDSYVVNPLISSPAISFIAIAARGFPKIAGNTRDSLVLDGFEYSTKKEDAMCCPSAPVRVTVHVDEKGNWKVVDKKANAPKK